MHKDIHSIHAWYVAPLLGEFKVDGIHELYRVEPNAENCRSLEASRLSKLLIDNDHFSFVRLGDMELTLLLAQQDELLPDEFENPRIRANGTQSMGSPGVAVKHVNRLKSAFEHASYVDFNQSLRIIDALLPHLELDRNQELTCNPDRATSYILPLWVQREFKNYCETSGHKVGIAGAEAALLQWLVKKQQFHEHSSEIWPGGADISFHQVREDGRNLAQNLDEIKDDLRQFVREKKLDTLFLSLGGGAKIVCHELANELGIRTVDFGAMTRSMCDLGSDGMFAARSTHSILLYRLPWKLVIDGILATQPSLQPNEILAKIHAQLIHQLNPDIFGQTIAANAQLQDRDSIQRFQRSVSESARLRRQISGQDVHCRIERKRFLHFCGEHKLTHQGRFFKAGFDLKNLLLNTFSVDSC